MNSEYFSKGVKHLKMRVAGPAAQREAYGAALGEAGAGEDRHPGQRDARKLGGGQPRLPATGALCFCRFLSQHCSKLPVPQDSAEMEDKMG